MTSKKVEGAPERTPSPQTFLSVVKCIPGRLLSSRAYFRLA